jgi:hypothetical protein
MSHSFGGRRATCSTWSRRTCDHRSSQKRRSNVGSVTVRPNASLGQHLTVLAEHPAARSRTAKSSRSLVTTASLSWASKARWASTTSARPVVAHNSPTRRDRLGSSGTSAVPASSRERRACRASPRQAWATHPEDVMIRCLRRRVASRRAATRRSPRSKAISAPVSRSSATQAAPRRRRGAFFPGPFPGPG